MTRWVRWACEIAYVALPLVFTIVGDEHDYAGWFLLAAAVTLPFGLVAFVGTYVGYAAVSAIGGLVAARTTSDGSDSWWLSDSLNVLRVVLFVCAAIGNLLVMEVWLRRRTMTKRRRQDSVAI